MAILLPRSLDKSRYSIKDEVAYARSLSPQQRLAVVASVWRMRIGEINPIFPNAKSSRWVSVVNLSGSVVGYGGIVAVESPDLGQVCMPDLA